MKYLLVSDLFYHSSDIETFFGDVQSLAYFVYALRSKLDTYTTARGRKVNVKQFIDVFRSLEKTTQTTAS